MNMRQLRRAGILGLVSVFSLVSAGAEGPSPEQYNEIEDAIAQNVAELRALGTLAPPVATSVPLGWPLREANGLTDPGYHAQQNFVDHHPQIGTLLDYFCGQRTIDSFNVNHRGTDIILWPFPWLKMAQNKVEVVSAAAGTIVFKQNGNYDKNCSCVGTANAVYVMHADGSQAWYIHLKNNSLTSKGVGASVAAGEYLGVVGSSGCSGTPHLHFELYNASGQLQDPYAGPCNTLNANSWWTSQRPYADSAVNAVVIGASPPSTPPGCAALEQPNETVSFTVPGTIFFTVYYRETTGGFATYRILRPDGSQYESWTYNPLTATTHKHTSSRAFPGSVPLGMWRFTVTFNGQTVERPFFIELTPGTPAGRANSLSVGKSPTGVTLTWGDDASCTPNSLYAVYIGIIGNYYSDFPLACNYSGHTAELTWLQVQGARYLLVVPVSANRDGSHGLDSTGAERPQGQASCFAQAIGCF